MESIEQKIIDQIGQKFGQTPRLDDGLAYIGVDSVGMAELTFEIESEFGITVTDDIFHVETVQELADYVRDRQQPASP